MYLHSYVYIHMYMYIYICYVYTYTYIHIEDMFWASWIWSPLRLGAPGGCSLHSGGDWAPAPRPKLRARARGQVTNWGNSKHPRGSSYTMYETSLRYSWPLLAMRLWCQDHTIMWLAMKSRCYCFRPGDLCHLGFNTAKGAGTTVLRTLGFPLWEGLVVIRCKYFSLEYMDLWACYVFRVLCQDGTWTFGDVGFAACGGGIYGGFARVRGISTGRGCCWQGACRTWVLKLPRSARQISSEG